MKSCPDCNGDGVIEKGTDDEQQCPTCGGSGFVPDDDEDNGEVIRTGGHLPARRRSGRLPPLESHIIKRGRFVERIGVRYRREGSAARTELNGFAKA